MSVLQAVGLCLNRGPIAGDNWNLMQVLLLYCGPIYPRQGMSAGCITCACIPPFSLLMWPAAAVSGDGSNSSSTALLLAMTVRQQDGSWLACTAAVLFNADAFISHPEGQHSCVLVLLLHGQHRPVGCCFAGMAGTLLSFHTVTCKLCWWWCPVVPVVQTDLSRKGV